MRRTMAQGLSCLLLSMWLAPAFGGQSESGFRTQLTKDGAGIVTHPPAATSDWGELRELPTYDPKVQNPWQVAVLGQDLRELDLRDRLWDLQHAIFDSRTKWPAQLPASFDPARYMELGKNPGLGLRGLHTQGITGKGVSIAIVDQVLLVDHQEYKDRLRLYEEIHAAAGEAEMHGAATASIAAGKTVGVAPEADLYYIGCDVVASPDFRGGGRDFTGYAQGINRILDINAALPADRKVRVISLSVGWSPSETGYQEITQAVERAKREGVFVTSSSLEETYGLRFHGLARDPMKDPDDPASYSQVIGWGPGPGKPLLLVPMDARCTAAPTGVEEYAFYPVGGWSWVTPYLAGLYALACQVKPDITPQEFWEVALETGDPAPPPPAAPVTREEARRHQAELMDDRLTQMKAKLSPEDFRKQMNQIYEQRTGTPMPDTMGEQGFREWLVDLATDLEMAQYQPSSGKIPNPARLVAALRATRESGGAK